MDEENKKRKRALIQKKLDTARKKSDEADRNYQSTGSPNSLRAMHNHDDMIMICELALQALDDTCKMCERQMKNAHRAAEKYREAKSKGYRYLLDFDNVISDFENLKY